MVDSDSDISDNGDIYERKNIKQTNWRKRHNALSTLEAEYIEKIENTITYCLSFIQTMISLYFTVYRMHVSTNDLIYYRGQLLHQLKCLLTYLWSFIESIFMDMNSVRYGTYFNEEYLPKKNRHIDDLDNEWARTNTRFNKSELRILLLHLRVPKDFKTKNIYTLSGETLFLI